MKYFKHIICLILITSWSGQGTKAQNQSLVNTSKSPHAQLNSVDMADVTWTQGFWAERLGVCKDAMVPHLWNTYSDPHVSHAFENFRIAAGLDTGSHSGPPFHDGDFYKLFESMASLYAITKDEKLDSLMDTIIPVIARAQREDGYIHTPVVIEQRKEKGKAREFEDRLNFETYNLGHLMTAACIHYRATGKTTLLDVAIRATDYLNNFYEQASPELARNAICPSHYMGVVEMYRTTQKPEYLALAKNLIDIRGYVENGTDHNQDRIPFRQQTKAVGHAVRANYLYAGVADVYMESGDDSLLNALDLIWDDMVHRKMYITGACGALYDGVSPDGTTYDQPSIQQVHQAYGREYQLPNLTAHNESCANVGNVLWNWRMLQVTGDARFADVMELALYNSVLSGISLDGTKYFYTNPLAVSKNLPYQLRWSGGREGYISLSNCCPPNLVRMVAEVNNYAYSTSEKGLWFHLYGSNRLSTQLKDGSSLQLTQETNYPWDGAIKITIDKTAKKPFSLYLRIPEWSDKATLNINGKAFSAPVTPGQYVEVNRKWSKGDVVELNLPMAPKLIGANPLVEESRNQVAVKRGPIVYCLESTDLSDELSPFDILIPSDIDLYSSKMMIGNSEVVSLEGEAYAVDNAFGANNLYREISPDRPKAVPIKLIPYYAWGNRGDSEMTVWMGLSR